MRVFVGVSFAILLTGCSLLKAPAGPGQLVGNSVADLAIAEYLAATIDLAAQYGLDDVSIGPVQGSISAETQTMVMKFLSRTPAERAQILFSTKFHRGQTAPDQTQDALTKRFQYFIRSGQAASGILCRAYLTGLSEENSSLEALRKEFGAVSALTNAAFAIFKASAKASNIYGSSAAFLTSSLDNYEDLAFLRPDLMNILDLVLSAQKALADSYTQHSSDNITLAQALNDMHEIEHQCTISGMRALLNKAASGTQLKNDPAAGGLSVQKAPSAQKGGQ
jgi:hypothetical protein